MVIFYPLRLTNQTEWKFLSPIRWTDSQHATMQRQSRLNFFELKSNTVLNIDIITLLKYNITTTWRITMKDCYIYIDYKYEFAFACIKYIKKSTYMWDIPCTQLKQFFNFENDIRIKGAARLLELCYILYVIWPYKWCTEHYLILFLLLYCAFPFYLDIVLHLLQDSCIKWSIN
jgi:hypothetical protein